LTGCASVTPGIPTAAKQPPETEPTTTTTTVKYSLARLCELISGKEAARLGGSTEGEEKNSTSDGHLMCGWAGATYLLIGFQERTSTANADTGPGITNTPTTIDGLPAVKSLQTDTIEICEVIVDLPSGRMFTSSMSVLTSGEGKYDTCTVAMELSNLVIPRVRDQ
jgi:hypothetical protein